MSKQIGIAKNTAAAIQFLDTCEAVTTYIELNELWLEFAYDDQVDVTAYPEHLVWFDDGAAPAEANEAQNAYHNV